MDNNNGKKRPGTLDIFLFISFLKRQYKLIVILTMLVALCSVVTAMVLPNIYRSSAVLINTSDSSSESSYKRNGNILYNFLESRDLQKRIVQKYGLLDSFCSETKEEPMTVQQCVTLVDNVYTVSEAPPLIKIFWDDKNQDFAKEMLDNVLIELNWYLEGEYVSGATVVRKKIEKSLQAMQAKIEKWELSKSENLLKPGVLDWRVEETALLYHELRSVYQEATIEEEKAALRINVLSAPYSPEKPYRPRKSFIIILSTITGFVLSIVIAFIRESALKLKEVQ